MARHVRLAGRYRLLSSLVEGHEGLALVCFVVQILVVQISRPRRQVARSDFHLQRNLVLPIRRLFETFLNLIIFTVGSQRLVDLDLPGHRLAIGEVVIGGIGGCDGGVLVA